MAKDNPLNLISCVPMKALFDSEAQFLFLLFNTGLLYYGHRSRYYLDFSNGAIQLFKRLCTKLSKS